MLSKTTEYAIRALVYISVSNKQGKRPGFKEISEEIDSPVQFTAKILQTLTRHKLVNSLRGRGGGFFFDEQHPETLSLYKVIRVIEGDAYFIRCGIGLKGCSVDQPCPFHCEFERIRNDYERLVKEETIASLSKKVDQGEAILKRTEIK